MYVCMHVRVCVCVCVCMCVCVCVCVVTRALTFSELFFFVSQTHRKVIAYTFQSQQGDNMDQNGHGTHTAGSLVGPSIRRSLFPYRSL